MEIGKFERGPRAADRPSRASIVIAGTLPFLAACAGGASTAPPVQLQTAPVSSVSSEQLAPPPGAVQQGVAQQVNAGQGQTQIPGQPGYQQSWSQPGQQPGAMPGVSQGQPYSQTLGGQQSQLQQQGQYAGQAVTQAQQVPGQVGTQVQGQVQSQVQSQAQQLQQAAASAAPPTREDLLGQWTIADNTVQCQLNVSLTGWQGGYRASTRNCHGSELRNVGAWNIQGSQIVLKNQDGGQIAVLQRSAARRFDGALSAGGPVAMLR
jgi:hypothetical protein